MSKNKEEQIENPFDTFDILKGNFVPPTKDDDIIDGDPTIIEDNVEEVSDEESESLKKGDKALEEVIKKQSKANSIKDDTEEEVEEPTDEVEDTTTNGYLDAIRGLSEKGILEFNIDEAEDSEEGLEKAIQETVNNKIKSHIATFGEEALDFLAFIEAGGDPKQFINTYYNEQSWESYNIENESSQKVAVRESLRLAGETPEDIEDMITEFEENGTLEKRAKSALSKLQKFEGEQKAQLVEAQKQRDAETKAANQKYWNDFKSDLDKKDEVKGFKLTPKLKEDMWKHMTQIDKATGKTNYQKAIENDIDAQLLFVLQSMNNFNIDKLEKQVANKAASKVAGLIKNYQSSTKDKMSSGRTHVDKDGEDPFALFSKIK